MRSFYCFVDWATTDLPGLDYAVAKAICTAAWSWLDHFHPEIGDEHGYPDFLVGTQPESWDQVVESSTRRSGAWLVALPALASAATRDCASDEGLASSGSGSERWVECSGGGSQRPEG